MYLLKSTIDYALKEYNKKTEDIKFVSYYIGNYLQTRQQFYCSYEEFINVVKDFNIYDLSWYYDIKFVADDWWLCFDSRGDWILNEYPKKPKEYKKPELELLKNIIVDYED